MLETSKELEVRPPELSIPRVLLLSNHIPTETLLSHKLLAAKFLIGFSKSLTPWQKWTDGYRRKNS